MTSLGVSPYDTCNLSNLQRKEASPHTALRRRARRASITDTPSMPLLSGFPFPFVQAPLPLTFAETNAIGTPVEVLSVRVSKPEARACIGVRLESDHHSFPRVARVMSEMTELHAGDIIRKVNGQTPAGANKAARQIRKSREPVLEVCGPPILTPTSACLFSHLHA